MKSWNVSPLGGLTYYYSDTYTHYDTHPNWHIRRKGTLNKDKKRSICFLFDVKTNSWCWIYRWFQTCTPETNCFFVFYQSNPFGFLREKVWNQPIYSDKSFELSDPMTPLRCNWRTIKSRPNKTPFCVWSYYELKIWNL